MIVLGDTTQSLQMVLGATVATTQPRALVSYRDIATSPSAVYVPTSVTTAANNTTAVTICAAPVSGHQTVIDTIMVYNIDTASITLTIMIDVSGTDTILWRGTLAAGDTLTYAEGAGWIRNTFSGVDAYVSSAGVITLPTASVPSAPPSSSISLFGRSMGGRSMLAQIGPSGLDSVLQPILARNRVAWWNPPGNATTVPGVTGIAALTALGTATARNVATTNRFTRIKRLGFVSVATAGGLSGARLAVAQYTLGTGSGDGGFFFVCWFGCSDAATVAGARQFVGLQASTAAPTNVEPSTIVNCIGVGNGAANSNLFLYYGGSAAQTPIDLGVNFPANTLSTDMYELILFASPNNTNVGYRVTRLNTGHIAEGTLSGTPGTQLPASTTLLTFNSYRTNNATALAVGIDFAQLYIETDY